MHKLKFCDEAHFVYKDLSHKKVLGLVGDRVWLKQSTLEAARGTLIILTKLDEMEPIVFDYTEETTSQWSFCDFVIQCCLNDDLVAGDYFIVDNAPVHHGEDSAWLILTVLEIFGVTPVFLPKYCPELNPCELVFSLVKNYIRYNHTNQPLLDEVLKALAEVDVLDIYKFYEHCIHPKVVLPDLDINLL